MCECLDYEDGDRYQSVVCADMDKDLRAEVERLRPLARFGKLMLLTWWDDGSPGDVDWGVAQEHAETAGLWHHVERHADGVECEWCNNEEPCGELTEAGLAALAPEVPHE